MIPAGFTADGSIKYTMTGLMPEVFDYLQVSDFQSTNRQNHLTGFFLQGIMNFTYTLIKPPDGQYGSIQPDGTWNGMIDLLANEENDNYTELALNVLITNVISFAVPNIPF